MCPLCQYENRKEAKFCLMCGLRLSLTCPRCDAFLPARARFCDQCGWGTTSPDGLSQTKRPAPGGSTGVSKGPEAKMEGTEISRPPVKQADVDGSGPKPTQQDKGDTHPKAGPGMGPGLEPGLQSIPVYIYRKQWRPKTRLSLFLTIFYVITVLFLLQAYLYPGNPLVRMTSVFPIFWANFVLLGLIFLFVAWCIYGILVFCYAALMRSRWFRPKLGEVLLAEGYVTEKELEEALAEQQMKLGEILLQQGIITRAQLEEGLEEQNEDSKRLGVILRERGYVTDEDIQRALEWSCRRLGQILEEKGVLRGDELYLGLGRQRFGTRTL